MNRKTLVKIITAFILWRLVLLAAAFFANDLLAYDPSFPYAEILLAGSNLPQWLYSWANCDGVHYLTIADKGYVGTGLIQAFFPVFPLLIKLTALLIGSQLIAGLVIANLAFVGVLIIGYRLTALDFDRSTAWWWVLVTLTFPTSFYFGSVYTESLFLLLVFYSLWYIRHQKNTISALLSGLSSGVRLVGSLLLPTLFLELRKNNPTFNQLSWLQKIKKVSPLLLSALGLAAFMLFLQWQFSDPLYFFHVQSEFGAGREETIVLLPQVLFRYVKILITARPFDCKYFTYVQDLIMTVGGLVILLLWWLEKERDKFRISYLWYAAPALLLPTLTGTLSSMPRYLLVVFPIFMWLAAKLSKSGLIVKAIFLAISISLLLINSLLFVQGYWVA